MHKLDRNPSYCCSGFLIRTATLLMINTPLNVGTLADILTADAHAQQAI